MKKRSVEVGVKGRKPVGAGTGEAGTVREGSPPLRLPDEPASHYEWFQAYWREGTARSLRDIARRLGVAFSPFVRARKRWRWDARIHAWLEEPAEVKQGWAARRELLREAEWQLHQECLEVGREALRQWRESGRTASLGDVVKLLEFGTKLARMGAGMPDNHVMITGEEGEPIRVQFEAALAQAYGPVVDVASQVVEVQAERFRNGKRDRKVGAVRTEAEGLEAGSGTRSDLPGAEGGGLRNRQVAGGLAGEGHPGPGNEGTAS